MPTTQFLATLAAARSGDEAAASELYHLYFTQLQRVIRAHLRDGRFNRVIDAEDVCQSAFGDFFTRFRLGQYDIDCSQQLSGLLAAIARHKVLHAVEFHSALRRNVRTVIDKDVSQFPLASQDTTPSERVSRAELVAEFRRRLTPAEREISERRAAGAAWADLAAELGELEDTIRMRFSRSMDRIAQELGI